MLEFYQIDYADTARLIEQSYQELTLHVVTGKPGALPKSGCVQCPPPYPAIVSPTLISHEGFEIRVRFPCGHVDRIYYGSYHDRVRCWQGTTPELNGAKASWGEWEDWVRTSHPDWWDLHVSHKWRKKPSGYLSFTKSLAMWFSIMTAPNDQAIPATLAFIDIFKDRPFAAWLNQTLCERTWKSPFPASRSVSAVQLIKDSGLLFLPESTKLKSPAGNVCLFMGWRTVKPGRYRIHNILHTVLFERLIVIIGTRGGAYIMEVPTHAAIQGLTFETAPKLDAFFKRVLGAFLSIQALKHQGVVTTSAGKKTRATQWSLTQKQGPCAHLRDAHWHTYRHGAGKKQLKTLWLEDIPVNGFEEASA